MTGSLTLGFSITASLFRAGVLATGVPSTCPVSMLQASNGTLLIASGMGPMLRMRANEHVLTAAGVPAPSVTPNIIGDAVYATEVSGTVNAVDGRPIREVTFDFTEFGEVYALPSVDDRVMNVQSTFSLPSRWLEITRRLQPTPQGLASRAKRDSIYNQYAKIVSSDTQSLAWQSVNPLLIPYYAAQELRTLLSRRRNIDKNGQPISDLPTTGTVVISGDFGAQLWTNLTGSFWVYDDVEALGGTGITGDYQCFQRWVDKDGYVSDPGPLSGVETITNRNTIKYDSIEPPADPRIVKRQIWRNTAGQLQNFYLDIETDDLISTEFTSSKTDEQLALSDLIAFTDVDGYTIPYLYGVPPYDKPFIAELRGRIFAVGSRRYSTGSAQVTNGSKTVTGIGTEWNSSLSGRRFIAGSREYLIVAVNTEAQELTLDRTYAGETSAFALYVIAPYAAEELVVRWSDPVAGPEAWPLTAQMLLPQDGDVITGIVNYGDALYITKTRNIYRLNFTEDPAVDGEVSPAARRGCINFRCAVTVEGACLMLDREGIHAFIGGPNPQHISLPVGDLFREETDGLHINWESDLCMLHAIHHQELSTVKWYVTLAGDMYPQHAICYDYRRSRFSIESYPIPVTSSCYSLGITGKPLLGTSEGRVLVADAGSLDLIEPGGTFMTIAAVNSAWSISLTEAPKACEGVPAVIVNGTAAGVNSIITYQEDVEIQFQTPMEVLPNVGDKVQLGGIPYRFKTAGFNAERMGGNNPKSFTMRFDPNNTNLYGTLTVFKNGLSTPSTRAAARSPWGATSRNHMKNPKHVTLDLSSPLGQVVEQLSFQGEKDTPANLEFQFQVDGSSGECKPKILEINVEGAG